MSRNMNPKMNLTFFSLQILNIFVPVYNIALFYSVHVHTNRNTYFLSILHVSSSAVYHIIPISNTNYIDGIVRRKKIPDVLAKELLIDLYLYHHICVYFNSIFIVSSQRFILSHNLRWEYNKLKYYQSSNTNNSSKLSLLLPTWLF